MNAAAFTVGSLSQAMERIAPTSMAESWDRVGLLVGDATRELAGPVLLTIDLTPSVMDEAIRANASAIIAYHPPIWDPLKRVTSSNAYESVILRAIESKMAIYSPHTALDAVPGGVADWLCRALTKDGDAKHAGDCRALRPHGEIPSTQQAKIVTFLPMKDVDRVREALASAGAGIVGAYRMCSFETQGYGTFFGVEGSKPSIGEAGRLERVAEVRLEMVCSKAAIALAVETMRSFHPYEEPGIEVHELHAIPDRSTGPGRRIVLDTPVTVRELAERIKRFLNLGDVRIALAGEDRPVSSIGVCPGSGGSLVGLAKAEGCQVYFTGEMDHHAVKSTVLGGMSVILAGHTNTERGFLPVLAEKLRAGGVRIPILIAQSDRDPLITV